MNKFLLMVFLVSGSLYAQTEQTTQKPVISVNGTSKISIVPDMTEVNIHVSSLKMTMTEATKSVGDQTQQYLKILKQLGFKEEDVKTTHFSASKNRIYKQNGPIDSGYVVSQNLVLKFPYAQTTLQKVVARFSDTKDPVNFSISFFVSDALREKTEADLQAKAVLDARRKATNLSAAAGVKLTQVKAISYGSESVGPIFYKSEMRTMAMDGLDDGSNLRFSPQEIDLSESVTVSWYMD